MLITDWYYCWLIFKAEISKYRITVENIVLGQPTQNKKHSLHINLFLDKVGHQNTTSNCSCSGMLIFQAIVAQQTQSLPTPELASDWVLLNRCWAHIWRAMISSSFYLFQIPGSGSRANGLQHGLPGHGGVDGGISRRCAGPALRQEQRWRRQHEHGRLLWRRWRRGKHGQGGERWWWQERFLALKGRPELLKLGSSLRFGLKETGSNIRKGLLGEMQILKKECFNDTTSLRLEKTPHGSLQTLFNI